MTTHHSFHVFFGVVTTIALACGTARPTRPPASPELGERAPAEWAACSRDEDCEVVPANCCLGCNDRHRHWGVARAHVNDASARVRAHCEASDAGVDCQCTSSERRWFVQCREGLCVAL